jgi:hypothetical protein
LLERIVNVDSGFDFRHGQQRRSGQFDKLFAHPADNKAFGSDSANLSPAALVLQRMHWQLLRFKSLSSERMLLHFVVDNIEFETELEPAISENEHQRFQMTDYFFEDGKKLRCSTGYTLIRKKLAETSEYHLAPLQAVKSYFDRAVTDSAHHDLPFSAIPEIVWYDGLLEKLDTELNNIYTGALAFVEKIMANAPQRSKTERSKSASLELERFTMVEM